MRNSFSFLNMEVLKEIYIVANTPSYLYKHFKHDLTIQKMNETFSTKELINKFNVIVKKTRKKFDDLIILYAIIIALTHKTDPGIIEFFSTLNNYDIKWFKEIKIIALSNYKPIQSYTVESKSVISLPKETKEGTIPSNYLCFNYSAEINNPKNSK